MLNYRKDDARETNGYDYSIFGKLYQISGEIKT
jgi:hypothetical protein